MMFQSYALFPHMTVADNIAFGLRRDGLPKAEIAQRVEEMLRLVQLTKLAARKPHQLSGGQQQRVAIARALVNGPSILMGDEPTGNLDSRTGQDVIALFRRLNQEQGLTVIIVTHDPEDAMRIADRIVLMRHGQIVQTGPGEELYMRPASLFVARFFSDFNEISVMVRGGSVETPFGRIATPYIADGQRAVICIRPQAVVLRAAGFCLPGRVVSRRFLGEVDVLQVAVQGFDRPLTIRAPEHKPFAEGADVGVDIKREEVLVFLDSEP
jgi:iron(III) transport system ATP-binding protein